MRHVFCLELVTQPDSIEVVPYRSEWSAQFERLLDVLRPALLALPATVEHVGSTSVPGLAAKPVLDVDIVVPPEDVGRAVAALVSLGYDHRGNLGLTGREAFTSPDGDPRRNVYVCATGTIHLRNHLAVREVLRRQRGPARRVRRGQARSGRHSGHGHRHLPRR